MWHVPFSVCAQPWHGSPPRDRIKWAWHTGGAAIGVMGIVRATISTNPAFCFFSTYEAMSSDGLRKRLIGKRSSKQRNLALGLLDMVQKPNDSSGDQDNLLHSYDS